MNVIVRSPAIERHDHHQFRGLIAKIAPGAPRPLWSVMIPVFNGAKDLRRSLGSVLANKIPSELMQIQVVDDCSTEDDPAAVVADLGDSRVEFHRQPQNVGHSRNFNTCINRARGHLVHILHADDWVVDRFYTKMTDLFNTHQTIGAAFCRHAIIHVDGTVQRYSHLERDSPGIIENWLETISAELRLQPPSMVVRRDVYEYLGGFDTRMMSCGEDWEMWVRIAAQFPVGFVPEVLAFYQDSPDSITKRSVRSGQNIRDVRQATRIARSYLRGTPALAANSRAYDNWADWALNWAYQMTERGDYRAAGVQLREALLCSRSPKTIWQATKIGYHGLRRGLERFFHKKIPRH